MSTFRQFISRIPYWAFLLIIVGIYVNSAYLFYRAQMPSEASTYQINNGFAIIDYVKPGGPSDKAGIKEGDTLVSVNSIPILNVNWESPDIKVGNTINLGILRNKQEVDFPVILCSVHSYAPVFFWSIYIIMVLFSIGSLYLPYKKPDDKAVLLFFIYIQLFIITAPAQFLGHKDPSAMIATAAFLFFGSFEGPVLIHFHLLFPRPANIITRYKRIPLLFYFIGALLAVYTSAMYIYFWTKDFSSYSSDFNMIQLWALTVLFVLALSTAIYQFRTIKDSLARSQLRIIIIGSIFSCITPISILFFSVKITEIQSDFPQFQPMVSGICGLVLICCILIAIFRYRIWDTELFIRKALLYLGATMVIVLTYLLLIWVVAQITASETNLTRYVSFAFSVFVFLVLRDRIQRLIDRIFHRELYDSATAVSDFEEKLAGIYKMDELKLKIAQGLDEIFHFKSFAFKLRNDLHKYEFVMVNGNMIPGGQKDFEITHEFDNMLLKAKVFSPGELTQKLPLFDKLNGELVIPMIMDGRAKGFFLCGPKQSEKVYSLQDIKVLSLLAKRVVALFSTAALYQKDLDRQLMLERERVRISQDMHDDVGASLTRISILSELAKNGGDTQGDTKKWLGQISDTSHEVMEEMSQIIWALNPKNDTLENLVAYLRRFASEYLEATPVNCTFNIPDEPPNLSINVEVRRNIYLVVREALHNVVKHSGATNACISIVTNTYKMTITVKDDGHGFDALHAAFNGNGLINMKKRMNDIDGKLNISSITGEGTEVELEISV